MSHHPEGLATLALGIGRLNRKPKLLSFGAGMGSEHPIPTAAKGGRRNPSPRGRRIHAATRRFRGNSEKEECPLSSFSSLWFGMSIATGAISQISALLTTAITI